MDDLRAITLRQPYPSAVAHRIKRWVTRSWKTSHRGTLLIHAGTRWAMEHDEAEHEWHGWSNNLCGLCLLGDALGRDQTASEIPLGAVVAVAELVDCIPIVHEDDDSTTVHLRHGEPGPAIVVNDDGTELDLWTQTAAGPHGYDEWEQHDISDQLPYGHWEPGGWAWQLEDITPLAKPIPAKGRQGIWRPAPDLAAQIRLDLSLQDAKTAAAAVTEGNQP